MQAKVQRAGRPALTLPAVIEPLLPFLMERPRTNLLRTSKAFAPWLAERKQAAADAMAFLTAQNRLHLCTKEDDPEDPMIAWNTTRTVELHSGLIRIVLVCVVIRFKDEERTTFSSGSYTRTRLFSPWASAFVGVDGCGERRIEELDEEKDETEQWLSEIPPTFRIG